MSYLKLAFLWCLAAFIALWAYLRLRRGKVTLLEGRLSPSIVRMVAIILVYLNGGCPDPKDPNTATAKPQATLSPTLQSQPTKTTQPTSNASSNIHQAPKDFYGLDAAQLYSLKNDLLWKTTIQRIEALEDDLTEENVLQAKKYLPHLEQKSLAEWLSQKLERVKTKTPDTFVQLCDLFDLIEENSSYDAWLLGYTWRNLIQTAGEGAVFSSDEASTLQALLGRLWYQQRVLHSLLLAEAEVGPVTFVPWRSKAAPPKGYSALTIPAGLVEAAKKKFATTDAATWDSEATLSFQVKSAPKEAIFFTSGESKLPSGSLVLTRFALLSVPSSARADLIVTHATLGELVIKPGQTMTAWNVKNFLSAAAISSLEATVEKAMKGDAKVLSSLESMLPAVEDLLREALAKNPMAKGASAIRTLLALFDE